MKTCTVCHQPKPETEFNRDKRTQNGYTSKCRACLSTYHKQWREENKDYDAQRKAAYFQGHPERQRESAHRRADKQSAYYKEWRAEHLDDLKAKQATYRAANEELRRQQKAAHYAANRERLIAKKLEYRAANRALLVQRTKEWATKNPEAARKIAQNRRARELNAPGRFTTQDLRDQLARQDGRCYYCHAPLTKYHIEHKTPLSRGGTNSPDNIVVACPKCNCAKHNKTADEWRPPTQESDSLPQSLAPRP